MTYFFNNLNRKYMVCEATMTGEAAGGKDVQSLVLAYFGDRVDVLIKSLSVARGQNLNFFFAQAVEGIMKFHLSLIRKLTEPWKRLFFIGASGSLSPGFQGSPKTGGYFDPPLFLENL